MTGTVIKDDLLGICNRLKSVDDGYFVFFNYKTEKFEVHHGRQGNTLCLVLPYDRLDERTIRHVLYTRAERAAQIAADIDRQNEKAQRELTASTAKTILNGIGEQ